MKLTTKQAELWTLADSAIFQMGGIGRITHNPDPAIREAAETEGTRQWALVEATRLASPLNDGEMTDTFCQKLIDIIEEGRK